MSQSPSPAPAALAYSVVVPFFEEVDNIVPLLRELRREMDALHAPYEAIFIDDGSTDGTVQQLKSMAATWPEASVFPFAKNQGQAAALYFGLHQARGAVLITMDGDGQNDPADIPRLLRRLPEADMIVGTRVNRQDSALRRRMSRLANLVRSALLADRVSDAGCALKVFHRSVVESFLPIRTLYSFMPAFAVASGFRVMEAPVHHRARQQGISKYGLGVMFIWPLIDMLGLFWYRTRRCRLDFRLRPPEKLAADDVSHLNHF